MTESEEEIGNCPNISPQISLSQIWKVSWVGEDLKFRWKIYIYIIIYFIKKMTHWFLPPKMNIILYIYIKELYHLFFIFFFVHANSSPFKRVALLKSCIFSNLLFIKLKWYSYLTHFLSLLNFSFLENYFESRSYICKYFYKIFHYSYNYFDGYPQLTNFTNTLLWNKYIYIYKKESQVIWCA